MVCWLSYADGPPPIHLLSMNLLLPTPYAKSRPQIRIADQLSPTTGVARRRTSCSRNVGKH